MSADVSRCRLYHLHQLMASSCRHPFMHLHSPELVEMVTAPRVYGFKLSGGRVSDLGFRVDKPGWG